VPVLVGANRVSKLFKDKRNCLLVKTADADAVAQAVTWAADHPKQLAQIALAGRKLYDAHFSQATVNSLVGNMLGEV
jgi:glycosyltransferase involved in cell wall biosynthesis